VRAHTRDWCVRDRATDGRARDLDYSSSRVTACARSRAMRRARVRRAYAVTDVVFMRTR